jgi:AcrR family transcriptional regulator
MTPVTSGAPSFPTRRAKAERNRDKILTAARTAFAEQDAEVSMAEISRRAGVGMATLYRNFPSRRELLEALYLDEIDVVCAAAETIDGETPGQRFEAWLRRFCESLDSKHHLVELLDQTDAADPSHAANKARVLAAGRPLLLAAQQTNEIRDDLTLEQILRLVMAITTIHPDSGYIAPILRTALDGLRTRPVPSDPAER